MNLSYKRVKAIIKTICRLIKQNIDYRILRREICSPGKIKKLCPKKTVILAPHADDEWVGCSGILLMDSTTVVCNMDMQGGDSTELHKKRYDEMSQIVESKCNAHLFSLKTGKEGKVQELIKVLENLRPYYVAVPFYYDWHEEHIEVMRILKKTLERMQKSDPEIIEKLSVLMYQVSIPIPVEKITHYIPMDKKNHIKKWMIFDEIYKSQLNIPWIRFQYNERINGKLVNSYAAEVYVKKEAVRWIEEMEKEVLQEGERKWITANLQDLKKIRKIIFEIRQEHRSI